WLRPRRRQPRRISTTITRNSATRSRTGTSWSIGSALRDRAIAHRDAASEDRQAVASRQPEPRDGAVDAAGSVRGRVHDAERTRAPNQHMAGRPAGQPPTLGPVTADQRT